MLKGQLFETAASYIRFIQDIGKERREAMGVYALEKDCNELVEWNEFVDFISEHIEIPNLKEFKWQVLTSQSRMHSGIRLPLGTASALLVATDHFTDTEERLIASSSNGLKALIAMLTNSTQVIEILSEDPCSFVRLAVSIRIADHSIEQEVTLSDCASWLSYDPYFAVRASMSGDIELLDPNLTADEFNGLIQERSEYDLVNHDNSLLNIWECNCAYSEVSPDEIWHRYFTEKNSQEGTMLRCPRIPLQFNSRVRGFDEFFIGTQPFPTPMADYLQSEEAISNFSRTGILAYLKGSIPDQFVINHAGHGVNSYSLNFRYAKGRLAISAQIGWGGAYMNNELQTKSWASMVSWLNRVMAIEQSAFQDNWKKRDILVVYSDFRGDLLVQERRGSEWVLLEQIKEPEHLISFLAKNL